LAFQRFCGLDYVRIGLASVDVDTKFNETDDTASLARDGGRRYRDEHTGPIADWEDFERFAWPDPAAPEQDAELAWWQENLPDDMCISTENFGHFCEWLMWLMGYETLCFALFDKRDLVKAIADKIIEINRISLERFLSFDRVKIVWSADDMGFKTGLLFSPDDMRAFALEGHRQMAAVAHAAGRPYILHACGKLDAIMPDLLDTVGIDARHSFEDTIEDVRDLKHTIGQRTALLGGIDVDFLCRADEGTIRKRVRDTLDTCLPGGGYAVGTGNSVTNYIPVENYLAMVDEAMLYRA
jgi:uroporphyrinogen decarboxylase